MRLKLWLGKNLKCPQYAKTMPEGDSIEEPSSSSSQIVPVRISGGCGRLIPNKGHDGSPVRCGDSLESRMAGYYVSCVECARDLIDG